MNRKLNRWTVKPQQGSHTEDHVGVLPPSCCTRGWLWQLPGICHTCTPAHPPLRRIHRQHRRHPELTERAPDALPPPGKRNRWSALFAERREWPGNTRPGIEVRWRPGQETSLAPTCSNLRSFGRKCTAMKLLSTLLGLFGGRGIAPPRYAHGGHTIQRKLPVDTQPSPAPRISRFFSRMPLDQSQYHTQRGNATCSVAIHEDVSEP